MEDRQTELRQKAMAMLDRRQLSRRQLVEKLLGAGGEEDEAESVAEWLADIGALNDEGLAESVVRHYSAKGFGRPRIMTELCKRGIDRETAEAALEGASPSQEAIDAFVSAKLKGHEPDKKELERIFGALRRRGHGYEEIRSALARYRAYLEDEHFDEGC